MPVVNTLLRLHFAAEATFLLSDLMTAASQKLELLLQRKESFPVTLRADCAVVLRAEELANTNAAVRRCSLFDVYRSGRKSAPGIGQEDMQSHCNAHAH